MHLVPCCAYTRPECVDCGSTNTLPLLKWPTNKKGIADSVLLLHVFETSQHGGQRVSEELLDFDLSEMSQKA